MSEEFLAKKWVYFDVFDKHFKLSFKPPEVDTCDLRNSARSEEEKFPVNLPVKTPVPISQQKYIDLMSLLSFVPSVCHDFYKNLVKGNDKTQDYPVSDESDGEV
ncbi:hypothetical protein J6590_087898 [Homalodisca vitripennis]|nr:hypothetical protein J6590_087898 [Homalodisca vitripennis]